MITYLDCQIDPATFRIYHRGREIFSAWHQKCSSLEMAKLTIDTSNKEAERIKNLPEVKTRLLQKIGHDEHNDNIRSHE